MAELANRRPTKLVTIFCDGSSLGNGRDAARAASVALLGFKGFWRAFGTYLGQATNQQAEIAAAALGLEALREPCRVCLHTDSKYVVETMSGRFRRKANHDWWKRLDAAAEFVVRPADTSFECRRLPLPAERRVRFADADRGPEFLRHRGGIALHEREQIRKATCARKIESFGGRVLEDGASFGRTIECEKGRRQISVSRNEFRVEANRLPERFD